jgi:aspartyl-tRNA synthetase
LHKYRTHNCSELRPSHENDTARLSGWVHRKRDHGNLLFIDLRDHYGITQCVLENTNKNFKILEKIKPDSVISITGKVLKRTPETINKDLPTGEIEVEFKELEILSEAQELPMPVFGEQDYPEDIRLKYRFLDLRRQTMHENIILRSKIISFVRKKMTELGFNEFQTPILTSSSPEGARDFLVPSRLNPGKFYALPQAPQQFKQMIMAAGFDKYFQIAPCFRDEDGRADRSPGEHYQLDMEMSFVEKEDIFSTMEPLFYELFSKFGGEKRVSDYPFKKISFNDSMLHFGTDKPDLRNPLKILDVTNVFNSAEIKLDIFKKQINKGAIVRAIPAPNTIKKPRSFYDSLNEWAKKEGASGLAYLSIIKDKDKLKGSGPIAKYFSDNGINIIAKTCNLKDGDAVFFSCEKKQIAEKISGLARQKIAKNLNLIQENQFQFCWIIDYPLYQFNEEEKKIEFSHNPFSMPKVSYDKFDKTDPLKILAEQYDLVCNGTELSSGAIRNHLPKMFYKVFSKVGYLKKDVDKKFGGMIKALSYGTPPHGGMAPGIDRIVMLLANVENIREISLFPLNQNAQDLLMDAPSEATDQQLKELNIKMIKKNKN